MEFSRVTPGCTTPGANLVLPKSTNLQLLEEINQRSTPEARTLFTNTDDHDIVDLDEDAATFELKPKTSNSTPEATPQDPYADGAMPSDAVADSSKEAGGTLDDFER